MIEAVENFLGRFQDEVCDALVEEDGAGHFDPGGTGGAIRGFGVREGAIRDGRDPDPGHSGLDLVGDGSPAEAGPYDPDANRAAFADELLDYHYATTYGGASPDKPRERHLARSITSWRPS